MTECSMFSAKCRLGDSAAIGPIAAMSLRFSQALISHQRRLFFIQIRLELPMHQRYQINPTVAKSPCWCGSGDDGFSMLGVTTGVMWL